MRRDVPASMQAANTPSHILKAILIISLVLGLVPFGMLAMPEKAYASDYAYLSVGDKIPYAGWTTTCFSVFGNEAYCGDPSSDTPAAGTYRVEEVTDAALLAGLWFGYGGPGFDASMWPSSWYDGSGMTANRYRALTHIVLSDIYAHNGHYSYGQCNSSFVRWCQDNVIGFSISNGELVNENVVNVRINWNAFLLNGAGESYGDVPAGFKGYLMHTGSRTQVILAFDYHPYGSLEIRKASANPDISTGNDCYTLEGAVYGLYTDPGCTNLMRSITTNVDGVARADEVPIGTYYVKEISAPRGYALSYDVSNVAIEAEQTTYLGTVDIPQNDPAYFCVQKYDGERTYFAHNLPQGSASLGGAEYRLDYYDGYFSTLADAERSGDPTRTWIVRTDEDGFAALDQDYVVSGGSLYTDTHGNPTLPLGTLVIRETKAPEGYLLDSSTVYVQQITPQGHLEAVYTYVTPIHPEQVIRGGVSIEKRDIESGLLTPLGGATLDKTEFKITNRSANTVIVDGIDYAPGAVVKTIYTDGAVASTAADCLPYGHYSIQETSPSTGYLLTDVTERFFDIVNDGEIVKIEGDKAPHNQVKRGDVELVKVRESDQRRLDGIPFRITSETTGESHVFVSDENGEAKTEAAWNPHTQRTNANDDAVAEDGTVDESKLDSEAGIWFGLTTEGWTVKADDALGALPYDTYQIDELGCSKNEGLELVSMKLRVSRHAYQVDLGSVDNQPKGQITLSTTARDGHDGDKALTLDPEATLIDRVEYTGLTVGATYTMQGTLMDKATGEPVKRDDGTSVTASKTFKAESASGYVELEFAFDATKLAGHPTVAFEVLVDTATDAAVAEHTDIEDFDQTVNVNEPKIGTTAKDGLDGDHAVIADGKAKVVDTITYRGLMVGKEYTAEGTIMAVGSNGAEPLKDADGNPVTASVTFTPEDANGNIDVTFEFDASLLAGMKLVAFEKVLRAGAVIADHEDPDDPSQTVDVVAPEIGTYAFDEVDGDKDVVADVSSKVVDKVSYQNLVPGRSYVTYGIVFEKGGMPAVASEDEVSEEDVRWLYEQAAEALGYQSADEAGELSALPRTLDAGRLEALLKSAESASWLVWGKSEFTPDAQSGSTDVPFEFDSRKLAGKELVVLEVLIDLDDDEAKLVADHVELESVDQSFDVVASSIGTLARDKSDGDHSALACKDAVIVDTVSYANLIPGLEYELSGVLMDKAKGKELMIGDKPVKSSIRFTPNASAGEVEVEFSFDSTGIEDHDLVVFEYLAKDDVPVAEHTDINDEAQSVHVTDAELTHTRTGFYDKTGVDQRALFALIAVLLVGGAIAGCYGLRKLMAKRSDESDDSAAEPEESPKEDE